VRIVCTLRPTRDIDFSARRLANDATLMLVPTDGSLQILIDERLKNRPHYLVSDIVWMSAVDI
jgi:hypothetical protein